MKLRIAFLLPFLLFIPFSFSQSSIDLKTIMFQKKDVAVKTLSDWGIKVNPSPDNPNYFYGFGTAFQMELSNGKVNTIWVYFTNEDGEKYPHQVDEYILPFIEITKVIEVYGTPDETGGKYMEGESDTNGWVKWKLKELQLH